MEKPDGNGLALSFRIGQSCLREFHRQVVLYGIPYHRGRLMDRWKDSGTTSPSRLPWRRQSSHLRKRLPLSPLSREIPESSRSGSQHKYNGRGGCHPIIFGKEQLFRPAAEDAASSCNRSKAIAYRHLCAGQTAAEQSGYFIFFSHIQYIL